MSGQECPRCTLGIDHDGDGNCGICARMSDEELSRRMARTTFVHGSDFGVWCDWLGEDEADARTVKAKTASGAAKAYLKSINIRNMWTGARDGLVVWVRIPTGHVSKWAVRAKVQYTAGEVTP